MGTLREAAAKDHSVVRLASGDGWTLRARIWHEGGGSVTVTAVSEALAESVLAEAIEDAAAPEPEDDSVAMGFRYNSPRRGPLRLIRSISTGDWADIRGNYASAVAGALDELYRQDGPTVSRCCCVARRAPEDPGAAGAGPAVMRLLPGRRALDPERLFNDPRCLMEVTIGEQSDSQQRWRLLILENCDELIWTRPRPPPASHSPDS